MNFDNNNKNCYNPHNHYLYNNLHDNFYCGGNNDDPYYCNNRLDTSNLDVNNIDDRFGPSCYKNKEGMHKNDNKSYEDYRQYYRHPNHCYQNDRYYRRRYLDDRYHNQVYQGDIECECQYSSESEECPSTQIDTTVVPTSEAPVKTTSVVTTETPIMTTMLTTEIPVTKKPVETTMAATDIPLTQPIETTELVTTVADTTLTPPTELPTPPPSTDSPMSPPPNTMAVTASQKNKEKVDIGDGGFYKEMGNLEEVGTRTLKIPKGYYLQLVPLESFKGGLKNGKIYKNGGERAKDKKKRKVVIKKLVLRKRR
ncbi:hypothetical protein MHBO_000705 [Bonamia ostreae]|uniref:Uncharacterized protein n=1 Tax=Bonamia ostreae TaxID=126728 RepID=A0ABV2AHR5_9EUKA